MLCRGWSARPHGSTIYSPLQKAPQDEHIRGLLTSTRILYADGDTQPAKSTYNPPKPVIKPRINFSVIKKRLLDDPNERLRQFGIEMMKKWDEAERERIEREKIEMANQKIRNLIAKRERQQKRQEEALMIQKIFRAEKERQAEIARLERIEKERIKKEARKEMLQALEEDSDLWERHPSELTYRKYKFQPGFQIRDTRFEYWLRNNISPISMRRKRKQGGSGAGSNKEAQIEYEQRD